MKKLNTNGNLIYRKGFGFCYMLDNGDIINAQGYYSKEEEITYKGYIDPQGLANAIEYAESREKRKTVFRHSGSYGYKHKGEEYIRGLYPEKNAYIPNGAMIIAFILTGFDTYYFDGRNTAHNVKRTKC